MESDQKKRANRSLRTTGFANPAEDFFEKTLDINDLVVPHPPHTFLYMVGDTSLVGLGILPGDRLLIDQAIDASAGRTVWVTWEQETAIKRVRQESGRLYLAAGDQDEAPVELPTSGQISLAGEVTTVIRPLATPPTIPPDQSALERGVDLNALLIANPTATFFSYVSGTSMIKAGIHPGDVLVVDRSLEVTHGAFVIAVIDGNLTIKRILFSQGHRLLATGDPELPPVEVIPQMQLQIWGVATYAIHSLLGPFPHMSRRPP
jgi:DNA polymerase V